MNRLVPLTAALFLVFPAMSIGAQDTGVRQVSVSDRSVLPLTTRLRFTTMIVLPPDQQLQEVICGDSDYWIISAAENIAHIKPAKEGASTNLNLVTADGAVYSFLLTETQAAPPDLKVYVNRERTTIAPPRPKPSDTEVADLKAQLAAAHSAATSSQQHADQAVSDFKRQYPTRLQFPFSLPKYKKPFLIRSVWHDGQFTYLRTDARELPALYELKDGKAALINFTVHNGLYVIPKILENGYLALGKSRLFIRQER